MGADSSELAYPFRAHLSVPLPPRMIYTGVCWRDSCDCLRTIQVQQVTFEFCNVPGVTIGLQHRSPAYRGIDRNDRRDSGKKARISAPPKAGRRGLLWNSRANRSGSCRLPRDPLRSARASKKLASAMGWPTHPCPTAGLQKDASESDSPAGHSFAQRPKQGQFWALQEWPRGDSHVRHNGN